MVKILIPLIVALSVSLNASYVKASGAGSTCSTAVNDALQNAVKSVAGAKIKSKSQVTNGNLDFDKIFSTTDGLIKNYKEISKESEPGYCEVVLKVNVVEGKIDESIDAFIHSKSSMRMFQKTSFKDRTVMVLYSTRKMDGAFLKNSSAVQSLMDDIQDQLRDMEFDIVLEDGLEGMAVANSEEITDNEAIAAANSIGADAIVLATLIHSGTESSGANTIIYSNALIKAYDPSTKRLFANVNKRSRVMSRANSEYAVKDGMAKGAIKAAKAAIPELVKKIVKNMSVGSKKVIKVVIKKIPSRIQRALRKALKNNEMQFKVTKRHRTYLVLEFDTTDNLTDFEDNFLDMWESEKLPGYPETISSAGSRIDLEWTK